VLLQLCLVALPARFKLWMELAVHPDPGQLAGNRIQPVQPVGQLIPTDGVPTHCLAKAVGIANAAHSDKFVWVGLQLFVPEDKQGHAQQCQR